jgi:hypothetical protein
MGPALLAATFARIALGALFETGIPKTRSD